MAATEALARFLAETSLRDIPRSAVELSKLVILDLLGVTLAASRQAIAKERRDHSIDVARRATLTSKEDTRAKFMRCATVALSAKCAEQLAEQIDQLESVSNIGSLMKLMNGVDLKY